MKDGQSRLTESPFLFGYFIVSGTARLHRVFQYIMGTTEYD